MAYEINNDNTEKKDGQEGGSIDILYEKKAMTKRERFSNFFYYYKTALIFSLIVIAVIIFLVIQVISKTEPDLYFLYSGRYYVDSSSYTNIQNTLSELINKDYNSDGKIYYELITKTVKTPQQAEKEQLQTDEYLYTGDLTEGLSSFRTEIMAGASIICFIDEQLYQSIADEGRLAKLSSVLGETPSLAIDEYGIYLKDTPFANACPELKKLSENTIVCIKKKIVTTDSEVYQNHLEAFKILFSLDTIPPLTDTALQTAEK